MANDNMTTMTAKNLQSVTTRQRVLGTLGKIGIYTFLGIMALIVLFPFYWMIISSLKTTTEYRLSIPTFWPHEIKWYNYVSAFNTANLGRLFMNTLYVGVVSTLLSDCLRLCSFGVQGQGDLVCHAAGHHDDSR